MQIVSSNSGRVCLDRINYSIDGNESIEEAEMKIRTEFWNMNRRTGEARTTKEKTKQKFKFDKKKIKCFKCGKLGHFSNKCRSTRAAKKDGKAEEENVVRNNRNIG